MSEKPIWWPYKARSLSFYGDYPAPLCKEIHDLLSNKDHLEEFERIVVRPRTKCFSERMWKLQKRNLEMYLSFFGVKDKVYASDLPTKYGINRERVRQIIAKINRRLFSYVREYPDIKLSIGVRYDPAIH